MRDLEAMPMLKPLPPGTYLARCKEETQLKAVANGHSTVWPESVAVSDGAWVRFLKANKQVFDCNAHLCECPVRVHAVAAKREQLMVSPPVAVFCHDRSCFRIFMRNSQQPSQPNEQPGRR